MKHPFIIGYLVRFPTKNGVFGGLIRWSETSLEAERDMERELRSKFPQSSEIFIKSEILSVDVILAISEYRDDLTSI